MERQLFRYDEVVESDIDTQSRVMKLLLAGDVWAFIKASNPYSVIHGFVGEKIRKSDNYFLYEPVKQNNVVAFRLDDEAIENLARLGEVDCQYFEEGLGFDQEGRAVRYLTVTRNYVPGAKSIFSDLPIPNDELESLAAGGVYTDEECESRFDLALYPKTRYESNISGLAVGRLFHDQPLDGIFAFSVGFIDLLIRALRSPGVEAVNVSNRTAFHTEVQKHIKSVGVFSFPYLSAIVGDQYWRIPSYRPTWHGSEIFLDAPPGEEMLCRPRVRHEYKLCDYALDADYLENGASSSIVPEPRRITVRVSQLLFLARDRDVLNCKKLDEHDAECRENSQEEISSERQEVVPATPCYESFNDVDGFSESREMAIEWICEVAKVEESQLSHADKLVDYAAIAICTWTQPLDAGKPNRLYCSQLMGLLHEDCNSYLDELERLVVLRFEGKNGRPIRRGVPMIKNKNDKEIWKDTILRVVFKAWKKFVFDRSRTAKKEKRRAWEKDLKAFLDRNNVKEGYVDAVLNILLSDQDAENLFQ
ncbi:MAG: hypothetical protein CL539_05215 [Alcanivorax sp.]|uniref:hypothetical protein n=1 Tax=Alcanivorax sp. TaxID=1872427 RepID=UPI000C8F43A6|nr:hypothetical protein [Alcanivorax sp.]MAC14065.1 hypothetical protein [Alcanivorax sp.]|tara:strand:+ start:9300 stop:10898 length:1599 start_codon:yes stop_codon:yes gene_type:complete